MLSLTPEVFDQAEYYENSSPLERKDGLKLIDILAPKGGSKVLDIGCGTGYHSNVLAHQVGAEGRVVAIDPDKERLQIAREAYPASNIEYLEKSAEDIPGDGYDLVFSNHVLHWCKDLNIVFGQVANKLKAGGLFAFNCTNQVDYPTEIFSDEFKEILSAGVQTERIEALAISHGFVELKKDVHECAHGFDDIHGLIDLFMIHSHGRFNKADFNLAALKEYYGNDNVVFKYPVITAILFKK